MDKLEIEYALAKQVPDMARGFTIATSYGELHVSAVDAPVVMKVVRDLLRVSSSGPRRTSGRRPTRSNQAPRHTRASPAYRSST